MILAGEKLEETFLLLRIDSARLDLVLGDRVGGRYIRSSAVVFEILPLAGSGLPPKSVSIGFDPDEELQKYLLDYLEASRVTAKPETSK